MGVGSVYGVHRVWVWLWAAVQDGRVDRKEGRGLRIGDRLQERVWERV